jgi:hypothetical protein
MGTTEYKVSIVIRATDKASKRIKSLGDTADKTTDELEELEDASSGVAGQLKGGIDSVLNMKSALMGMAIVGAGKAIWELGELGAQSLRTGRAFEAISGGSDEAARNLEAMKRATRGAMSEQEMMSHSSRLMQMGLASSAEELEELTTMAVRLGTAMGRDATGSVEDFALMLANQSIPRLDTFGMSAGKARARILELQAATEGMTREEAFLQVVREQGAEAMAKLGEYTEDEMLATEQLSASFADLKAVAGEALAPALAQVAGGAASVVRGLVEAKQATAEYRDVLGDAVVKEELMSIRHSERHGALDRLAAMAKEVAEAERLSAGQMADYAAMASEQAIPATAELSILQEELALNAQAVAKSFGEIELDTETMWQMAAASGASLESLGALAETLGIAASGEIEAVTRAHELTAEFGAGRVTAEEYKTEMELLNQKIENSRFVADQTAIAHEAMSDMQQNAAITAGEAELRIRGLVAAMHEARVAAGDYVDAMAGAGEGGAAPGYQYGTGYHPGGGMVVGESGPEFLVAPRGTRVETSHSPATQRVLNDQRRYDVSINDRLAGRMWMEQMRADRMRRANRLM